MGKKCSVYGCKSGYYHYTHTPCDKITIYSFPKDEEECQRWTDCMPIKPDKVTKHMGICALHWPADALCKDMKMLKNPRPLVPPSVFPSLCDSHMSSDFTSIPRPTKNALNCSGNTDLGQQDDFDEAGQFEISEGNMEHFSTVRSEKSIEDRFEEMIEETTLSSKEMASSSKADKRNSVIKVIKNASTFSKNISEKEFEGNADSFSSMDTDDSMENNIEETRELPTLYTNKMNDFSTDQRNSVGQTMKIASFSIGTSEKSNEPVSVIVKITFLWCSYCDFSTDTKQDLVTHINNKHIKTCPHCPFRSTSQTEVTKHIECGHKNRMQIDCLSNTETDVDPVSACEFCSFMSYSTEHLQKHTNIEHPGMFPKSSTKIIFKYISARVRQADYLFYSCLLNETCEGGDVLDSDPQFISTDIRIRGIILSPKQEEEDFSYSLDQSCCIVPANNIESTSNACPITTRDMVDGRLQNECFVSSASTTFDRNVDNHDVKLENELDDQIIGESHLSSKNPEIVSLLQKQSISEKPKVKMRIDSSNWLSENEADDSQNSDGDDDNDDKSLMPFPSDQLKQENANTNQEEVISPVIVDLNDRPRRERHRRQIFSPGEICPDNPSIALTKSEKRRIINKRFRERLKSDLVRFAQYKACDKELQRQYRLSLSEERKTAVRENARLRNISYRQRLKEKKKDAKKLDTKKLDMKKLEERKERNRLAQQKRRLNMSSEKKKKEREAGSAYYHKKKATAS